MTTVEKMQISGIRSFSPYNDIVLNFYAPLSLIVGHNGAGKTTVIECLKQATTGALPPNCKNGQNFIHDPEVCAINTALSQAFLTANHLQLSPAPDHTLLRVHRYLQLLLQNTSRITADP